MANTEPAKKKGILMSTGVFNLPNQLTSLRLLLSVIMFAFLSFEWYLTSFVLFIVAAGTDWFDGYFARKYNLVTVLGRILDPFADKVIICGAVIYLAAAPGMQVVPWGFRAWMAVIIVGRELLVTALRGFLEQSGKDFSAKWVGKWKMLLQCFLAGAGMLILSYTGEQTYPDWLWWFFVLSTWGAIILTVYSGLIYIERAVRLARE